MQQARPPEPRTEGAASRPKDEPSVPSPGRPPAKPSATPLNPARLTVGWLAHWLVSWLVGWWRVLYFGAQILVLAFSPSSYSQGIRAPLARHVVQGTAPILLWFTLICAVLTLVITRIVVVTALSYGLSQYALQVIIRVLVLELIPLSAALFVALRSTMASSAELADMRHRGELEAMARQGRDPLVYEAMPRVLGGVFASITLAALSCVVALLLAYVAVYGFTVSAVPAYTRLFGQVFNPAVTLIFVMKTVFFSLAVALMPMASALHDEASGGVLHGAELRALARMFLVILLIEVVSLVGNYY
jgi:phospholipid/cholesterol/gamma-HCH transport system permease protein